jgi:hypothetical protein
MAKKALKFNNYTYSFDKNEKKLVLSFCNQAVKEMATDSRFAQEVAIFNSIIEKLNSPALEVKLTRKESTRLAFQLRENTKQLKKKLDGSSFIKKWFYKSIYSQYQNLLDNHFED